MGPGGQQGWDPHECCHLAGCGTTAGRGCCGAKGRDVVAQAPAAPQSSHGAAAVLGSSWLLRPPSAEICLSSAAVSQRGQCGDGMGTEARGCVGAGTLWEAPPFSHKSPLLEQQT